MPQQQHQKSMMKHSNPYRLLTTKQLLRPRIVLIAGAALITFFFALASRTTTSKPITEPRGFEVRPKYSSYTKVPEKSRQTYYIFRGGQFIYPAIRAFNSIGWERVSDPQEAQIIWDKDASHHDPSSLKSWQRYNQNPGWVHWDSKAGFARGFNAYSRDHPEKRKHLHVIPETYLLSTSEGIKAFRKRLFEGGGMNLPWVFKHATTNNSKGVIIAGPNSKELKEVERSLDFLSSNNFGEYIAQAYICNEMKWWGGRKFDLRFYWLVASLDPLIVLTHVGFVRVGGNQYNGENDFSETSNHLTASHHRSEKKASSKDLEHLIHEKFQRDHARLSKTIKNVDPFEHVHNQIRSSVAETVAAFKDVSFRIPNGYHDNNKKYDPENGFSIYGADFVIDDDLDVWYTESQSGPAFPEEFPHQENLYQRMFKSAFQIVDEIQMKIQNYPSESILPLKDQGEWDLVYAEDDSNRWMYEYETYIPPKSKKACGETINNAALFS